jgi:hypothetical protein
MARRGDAQSRIDYENLSPLLPLYGVLLSYLLFSSTRCASVAGACLVAAGSLPASWLGEPEESVLAASEAYDSLPPMDDEEPGWVGTFSEYSIE